MERIDKSISKEYLPLTIYRDDLEEIATALPADAEISISTGDYKFTSVAEFAEHTKADRIYDLEFKSREPYMIIEFRQVRARIYVGSSAPMSAGVFFAVDQILKRNRRFLAWCYSLYFVWIINGLLFLSTVLFIGKVPRRAIPSFWYPAINSMFIAAALWIFYVCRFRYSVVIPRYRHTARGFFVRNRDNLIVAVIAAIIGAIAGVTLTLLFVNPYK